MLYAGNSRCADAERRAVNRVLPLCKTKIGYGYDQRHFGPEAGMAQAFSAEYNEKSGKKACIVKYAAGGTSLLDSLEGSNACEGNWTPPSYALAFGAKDGRTGGLYRRFMAQAAAAYAELVGAGYSPRACGLYWMQGEDDRAEPEEYARAFPFLAADFRRDLGALFGADLSGMPLLAGEISRTFAWFEDADLETNARFIGMQNGLEELREVYVVKNSVFDMVKEIGGEKKVVGTDAAHWNYADALAIGRLVGEKFLQVRRK